MFCSISSQTFNIKMIPILNHFGIVFLFLLHHSVLRSSGNCTLADGTTQPVDSRWTSDKGCQCQCIGVQEMYFVQCEDCKKRLRVSVVPTASIKTTCHNNGFNYFENETWMSPETACTQCRCGLGGLFTCESDKHCSNTCQDAQIPQYGPCCEVVKCLGKVSKANNEGITCWDKLRKSEVKHGYVVVMPEACIDKFCICYNGDWKCHNYCNFSHKPLTYWNKLCCPRPAGFGFCTYRNQSIQQGKSHYFIETGQNCTCVSDSIYCDNDNSYQSTTSFSTTSYSATPATRSSILIILICVITFLLCCLLAIVICNNVRNHKRKSRHKEPEVDDILLKDCSPNEANVDNTLQIGHI